MTVSSHLTTRMVEKVWGRGTLPPPFAAPDGQRIGEIWFEPPPMLDALMVKYLFTSQKLSIQVHPDAALAQATGTGITGKDECWLVIAADEGAVLGVGFREPVSKEHIRSAALDGSIEDMIAWHPVKVGDFFYIPAGTIHAIGPGVSLIEVQQNSDITYRLYDYGRPRELHLERGIEAVTGEPHPAKLRRNVSDSGSAALVDGPFFRLDQVEGAPSDAISQRYQGALLAIPLTGEVKIGSEAVAPGECGVAGSMGDVTIPQGVKALLAGM